MNPRAGAYRRRNPRLAALAGVIAALFVVLVGGLAWRQLLLKPYDSYYNEQLKRRLRAEHPEWSDQVLEGEYAKQSKPDYNQMEEMQMFRRVLQPGPRGDILDRNGQPLAGSGPRYSVVLYVNELRDEFQKKSVELHKATPGPAGDETAAEVAVVQKYLDQANALLGRTQTLDTKALKLHLQQHLLLPFPLINDLTPAEFARFNEQVSVQSPMQTYVEAVRNYSAAGIASAHVLGYVGQSNEVTDDVLNDENVNLKTFAYRGKKGLSGLEAEYNDQLQGETGGQIWIVDPSGYLVPNKKNASFAGSNFLSEAKFERIAEQPPGKGQSLVTSLDSALQLTAAKAIGDKTGSVVALDVRTGEVLAMVSKPDYNLYDTVPSMSFQTSDDIENRGAWLNRATQGLFPPGSTFKLLVSIAGLRAGILDENTSLDCGSSFLVGNRYFKEDAGTAYGKVDLVRAIQVSCDVFFYQEGLNIGPEKIAAEARNFGLDKPTGIDLGETKSMIVPDPAWKALHRSGDGPWSDGDTANFAIGQGYLLVTPLQMACFMASLACDRTVTHPTLLHDPNRDPGAVSAGAKPIGLTPTQRALLLEGMEKVVTSGTAPAAQVPGVTVAGKTGTAQVGKNLELTDAWFICFAPVENPRIAVAVVIQSTDKQHEFWGGSTAGPIAEAVMEKYFKEHPDAAPPATQIKK